MTTQEDIAVNGIQDILLGMATKELQSRTEAKVTKQIVFEVSDEISDELFEEIESTLEFCLLDLHDEVKMEDRIVVLRLVCRWCGDDITKKQSETQGELCNVCYAEYQDDEDDYGS